MSTSYSTNLALALPATGELSGTWGTTVNTNITNMLDEALGYQAYSATGGADTITIPDGTTGVARSIYIQLNGTGGGSVAVPATKTKMYFVFNNTASAITFKVTGQTGVSIPAAAKMALVSNGTDVIVAQNYFSALTLGAALPVASGGTGLTAGTSGGVLAYTATGTLASSTALAANALVIGGGAGAAPSTTTTGTGVVTALGVNVGTAGAFVVNGGALGTPSSGTVTNLTGTASININGTVGATTPAAGSFTTVGGTVATFTGNLNSFGGATADNVIATRAANGNFHYRLTNAAGSLVGGILTDATDIIIFNGANVAKFTSTGLNSTVIGATTPAAGAFTTLSATQGGTQTPTFTSTVNGSLVETILVGKNSTGTARQVNFGINRFADDVWSLSNGTTEYLRGSLTSGGLAVTGTLSATGTLSGGTSGTGYSFSGSAPAGSLTLDSGGNLGIGTASPQAKLHVANSSSAVLFSQDSTTATVVGTNAAGTASQGLFLRGFPLTFTGNGGGGTTHMTLDSAGNLGLGVTPSAWSAVYRAFQIGAQGAFWANATANDVILSANLLFDVGNTSKYIADGYASYYLQNVGEHIWKTAPNNTSGAGAAATFTQAMTLDASGNLGVGATSISAVGSYRVLDLNNTTGGYLSLSAAGTRVGALYASASAFGIEAVNASANMEFIAGAAERMRITSAGNVGIGTSSPAYKLHVRGADATANLVVGNTTEGTQFEVLTYQDDKIVLRSNDSSNVARAIAFETGLTERARIDSSGNLLVGTTSNPGTRKVSVVGSIASTFSDANDIQGVLTTDANTVILAATYGTTGSYKPFTIEVGGSTRIAVTTSGIVTMSAYGVGTATFSATGVISSVSDETWKIKDGVPVDTDSMLKKLEPGYWYYNDEKKETFGVDRQLGFYAQNVNAAIGPEAAPTPEEGKPWGYYDRSVLAITVMSLQKALATIETLTARITALETA